MKLMEGRVCNTLNWQKNHAPNRFIIFVGIISFLLSGLNAGAEIMRISGVTESSRDITMSVPEQGVISKIYYSVGDKVIKDKPIIELDNRREKLEEERRKLIWESKVELVAATQRADTLLKVYVSSKKLYESTHSISSEELDKQKLDYDVAVADQNKLAIAEDREELEYKIAAENYQRRIIRAPINGIIVKLLSDVGEYIEPGKPLLEIVDSTKCYMICQLEEKLGRSLKKGRKVDVEVKAGNKWLPKKAKVVFASPVVDQASGLLEIKLEFDNSDGRIRPGVPGVMLIGKK